ncbi:MAG: 6-hydroxymethylpterin diphosphokinase MptE-like protein [Verrucomicrobiota bacterium]
MFKGALSTSFAVLQRKGMTRYPFIPQPLRYQGGKILFQVRSQWSKFCFDRAGSGLPLRRNEQNLAALKDAHKGERIFVLGNGPSLKETDVDRLCGEVTIASNSIFLLFDEKKFRPSYYTIEDTLVAEDRRNEATNVKGAVKVFPEDLKHWLPPAPDTIHINFRRNYEPWPRFTSNFNREVFWGGTVSFLNLQLAFYLGASEVYLIGFDHNYEQPAKEDDVEGTVIMSNSADVNHFHPDYFGKGYRWHDPMVDRMERGYICARDFFESHNRKIFNATAGGRLEVFDRVGFSSLF